MAVIRSLHLQAKPLFLKSPSSNDGINSPSINESVISAKTNNPKVEAIIVLNSNALFKEVGRNFLISPSFYLKSFYVMFLFKK
jgi:hypothetical protein